MILFLLLFAPFCFPNLLQKNYPRLVSSKTHDLKIILGNEKEHTKEESYLIKLKDDTDDELLYQMSALLQHINSTVKTFYDEHKLFHVSFQGDVPIDVLGNISQIEHVERNRMIKTMQVENNAPWGLDRISHPGLPLQGRFSFNATGQGVNIYVIDAGLVADHQELSGRSFLAYSAFGDTALGPNTDSTGHGTHVSGIAAGRNVGVAKAANVYALRVIDPSGAGDSSLVINALDWIGKNYQKPCVINMSLGGSRSPSVDGIVKALVNMGIPVVCAAGNFVSDTITVSPAAAPGAIAVAASSITDSRSSFSNYGSTVFIHAPGENILSSVPVAVASNGYEIMSGTSMAAPFVTGVIATILEKQPNISMTDLRAMLASYGSNVIPVDSTGTTRLLLQMVYNGPSDGDLVALLPGSSIPSDYVMSLTTMIVICCGSLLALFLIFLAIKMYEHRKKPSSFYADAYANAVVDPENPQQVEALFPNAKLNYPPSPIKVTGIVRQDSYMNIAQRQ